MIQRLIFGFWVILLIGCGNGSDGLNNQEKFAADFGRDPAAAGISISSVSPSSGPATGGTLISLVGSGFIRGMRIALDGVNCSAVNVVSQTQATCVTGPHAVGAVDVVVTNVTLTNGAGTQTATRSSAFEYESAVESKTTVAVTSGGGISFGTGMQLRAVIGEIQSPLQTGTGILLQGGVQGSALQPGN